jgi:predicted nucleic-acid-binding protein
MIGIDTNVLLRIFVADDDPAQHRRCIAFMRAQAGPVRVNLIVLVEAVWTLERRMKKPRSAIIDFVDRILKTDAFELQAPEVVRNALADFVAGPAGFADYLIARLNAQAGCSATFTFDSKATRLALYSPVP